ncbi:hypothetical protein P7K49_037857, partial [Saguinus oedipus]
MGDGEGEGRGSVSSGGAATGAGVGGLSEVSSPRAGASDPSRRLCVRPELSVPQHSGIWEAGTDGIFHDFPSQSASFELCSNPGVLLPPPAIKGAVPLYNPSQFPQ